MAAFRRDVPESYHPERIVLLSIKWLHFSRIDRMGHGTKWHPSLMKVEGKVFQLMGAVITSMESHSYGLQLNVGPAVSDERRAPLRHYRNLTRIAIVSCKISISGKMGVYD
ncbi:hypothetical protein NPIL_146341 [Nephila pilipes]|uniref:Uncharacterized protein n=1 Tax=Nephila pilipes TaxID=299642 RepID=A0A8X6U981_NEPPI|nr:hypothetical protein NPIL_146341 [Nephila pilipes]